MSYLNIEIKARSSKSGDIRQWLLNNGAEYKGLDHQVDTYFKVAEGRLKLREGNIENNLIFYQRDNQAGPKSSHFELMPVTDPAKLKTILAKSIGVKVVVDKKREIYYINNVKFHIDEVQGLGSFVEIEAGNIISDLSKEELLQQCEYYMQQFGIEESDLLTHSYSDMLLEE